MHRNVVVQCCVEVRICFCRDKEMLSSLTQLNVQIRGEARTLFPTLTVTSILGMEGLRHTMSAESEYRFFFDG